MTASIRRSAAPVLVLALVASLSACTSDSLRERDARGVRVGQVLPASYTAAVRGKQVHVMVPSGRVDLTLGAPVDEVPAQDTAGAAPLRPTEGATAVGVAWSLNRGGFPDSPNRQLTEPTTIFGGPQPVRLYLVTDGTRREIKDVGTLEVPTSGSSNAAWVVVPSGVRQWHFEVGYAGITQRVDARTGKVTPGAAAALYRPLPRDRRGSCTLGDGSEYLGSCLTRYAVGYPYVDGLGWAPTGRVFALVRISVDSADGGDDVEVGGVRSVGRVTDSSETFRAYPVPVARTYAVRGTARIEGEGKPVVVRLTGTLTGGAS